MSREPSAKTVHITVPIVVAIISLFATIAAALIGIYDGRKQESTKTVELLAEKFDSVDKKMSYEEALQVIYEDSQKIKQENQSLSVDNAKLKSEIDTLKEQNDSLNEQVKIANDETNKQTIASAKSYAVSNDYENALALLNGVMSKTPEMEVLIKDYTKEYEQQIISQANILIAEKNTTMLQPQLIRHLLMYRVTNNLRQNLMKLQLLSL